MSSLLRRFGGWLGAGRTAAVAAVLAVLCVLPLAVLTAGWWEFSDEIYAPVHPYQAPPAQKLARLRRGEGPPLIFAHRGDHLVAPENSVQAYERAVYRDYDGIELDVINSADNVPVVSHNFHIGPDGSMFIPTATAAQIGGYADSMAADHATLYPTLDDVLGQFAGRIAFIIEIKAKADTTYGIEPFVCKSIKAHGAANSVIVSSLKYHVIETLQQTPACAGIWAMYEVSGSGSEAPADYRWPVLSMRHDLWARVTRHTPAAVRAFSVYTPNRAYFIDRAIDRGALLLQTDRPGRAMRLRDETVGSTTDY